MRTAVALFLAITALVAQNGSHHIVIEACGIGGGPKPHECTCIRRTQAIQEQRYDACVRSTMKPDGSQDDKALAACNQTIPTHCDIAESLQDEDGETEWAGEDKGWVGDKKMGEFCTMACKIHDCTCDDGPTCHFSHTAADHEAK